MRVGDRLKEAVRTGRVKASSSFPTGLYNLQPSRSVNSRIKAFCRLAQRVDFCIGHWALSVLVAITNT